MKQTEITVQVFSTIEDVVSQLKKQGFKLKEKFVLKDYYFTNFYKQDLKNKTYKELIENSVLVRNVFYNEQEKTQLIFKNKNIDKDGNVLSEEKLCTKVDNFEVALKIFNTAKFNNWCSLIQNVVVYKNGETEMCVQNVEGLGVFIEYEEEPNMAHLTEEEKLNNMIKYLKGLNLNIGNDFSCKKVLMKYCLINNKNKTKN